MQFSLHYKAKSSPSFVVAEMMMVGEDAHANEEAELVQYCYWRRSTCDSSVHTTSFNLHVAPEGYDSHVQMREVGHRMSEFSAQSHAAGK